MLFAPRVSEKIPFETVWKLLKAVNLRALDHENRPKEAPFRLSVLLNRPIRQPFSDFPNSFFLGRSCMEAAKVPNTP
jgi:hypothetical protein